jgi:hypothetical protein
MNPLLRCSRPCRLALSDHSIKAARHATKYYLISRILDPKSPNAGACGIAPRDALGLRLRHTAIDAYLVAIGAFYQTRRKPMPLPLGERRLLGSRERRSCRGHDPKHRQGRHRYFAKVRHYPKGRTVHRPASSTLRHPQKPATPIESRKNVGPGLDTGLGSLVCGRKCGVP